MKRKPSFHPGFQVRTNSPIFTFIIILIIVSVAGCNFSLSDPESSQGFADPNARMYQMYFDTSGDPAHNQLQVRRFIGHIHMPDIEEIFTDIGSLSSSESCGGGPILDEQGRLWYVTLSPDLVGANLVSIAPDGTKSSAFDLNGDRVVDILDTVLRDNRRISIFTEELGMGVFNEWLQGRDPFCSNEITLELGLPDLGCSNTGDGSSGDEGFGTGSGIADPVDVICSEYDTSPWAGLMNGINRSDLLSNVNHYNVYDPGGFGGGIDRTIKEFVYTDANTGEFVFMTRIITDVDRTTDPPHVTQVVTENVDALGHGVRVYERYNPDGSRQPAGPTAGVETFKVNNQQGGSDHYDSEDADPPLKTPAPVNPAGGSSTDAGPEGDDSVIAEFCSRRANYESGVEQAVKHDPSAISISCGDLSDAPTPNCKILEWAKPEDWRSILIPPSAGSCDAFDDPEKQCEGGGVEDRIRSFLGNTAELWSLDTPDVTLCSPLTCDPSNLAQLRKYTAGEVNTACSPRAETSSPSSLRCDVFKDVDFSLVTLDWQAGQPVTFYTKMTGGVPGLEIPMVGDAEPVNYFANWGDYNTNDCKFLSGYPERLYCTIQLPSEYGNTTQPFELYVNGCERPVYSNFRAGVPIYIDVDSSAGGDGGNTQTGCNLSVAVCSAQGQSFDENNCACVDIQ